MKNELINGKAPEEIKQELQWLAHGCPETALECDECIHAEICSNLTERDVLPDALALIERLEAERDAAFRDIPHDCGTCKYWQDPPKIYESKDGGLTVAYCDQDCSDGFPCWVWRGVVKPLKEENV